MRDPWQRIGWNPLEVPPSRLGYNPGKHLDAEDGIGLIETSAALAACLLVLVIAVVFDRRPYRPGKRDLVMLMIVALAASLVLARHLLTLIL